MITINQSVMPDIKLSDMPHNGLIYLSCNGDTAAIEYDAVPELIEILKNFLRAQ